MFSFIVKLFIKNSEDVENPTVREKYGVLSGIVGIILNIIMSTAKIVAGAVTGAISVLSDGINNLSDAGSSVVTFIGFKLSSKKPDKDHPFGHGRMEYFAGLVVSVIILIVAFELFMDSLNKIIYNKTPNFESQTVFIITLIILGVSILIKLWMALFNRFLGKKINSVAMKATSLDSISDAISTTVVLICAVLSIFIKNIPIDGFAGIIVSLFIAFTGLKSVAEVVRLLLGQAPDPDLVKEIADYVLNFDKNIVGFHDLMVHDYGAGRKIIVLHVEVPAEGDILELHDIIDNVEKGLQEKFNCMATIHLDPVVTTSERVKELKNLCVNIVKNIDENFTIHDFRMNEGETHANVIFDVVITHDTKLDKEEIINTIKDKVKEYDSKINVVLNVEYSYV